MGSTDHPTVFVVDGQPETRDHVAGLASSLGLAVESFESGEEFLQAADLQRRGCLIAALRLPGINGIELHRRLVEAASGLPVILVSAYLNVRSAAHAFEQGVFRVLEKPCQGDELASAIRQAVECDHAQREQRRYRLDLKHRLGSLDDRERSTLDLILSGSPDKVIQRRMGWSRRTIGRVKSSILAKTQFLSFVELSAACGEVRAETYPR